MGNISKGVEMDLWLQMVLPRHKVWVTERGRWGRVLEKSLMAEESERGLADRAPQRAGESSVAFHGLDALNPRNAAWTT